MTIETLITVLVVGVDRASVEAWQNAAEGREQRYIELSGLDLARDWFCSHLVDVAVCELSSPAGAAFSRWLASHSPNTPVIVPQNADRGLSAELRATGQVPPGRHHIQDFSAAVELVQLVAKIGPRRGIFGQSIEVELFDYVQLIAIGASDRTICVESQSGPGILWFVHGDIVHAELGELRGEEAFYRMVESGRGGFRELVHAPPPEQSIQRSSTHLLMEAARRSDEAQAGMGSVQPAPEPSGAASVTAGPEPEDDFVDLGDDDLGGDDWSGLSSPTDLDASTVPFTVAAEAAANGAGPFRSDPGQDMDVVEPGLAALGDDETRNIMLEQFFEYEGVSGVAIMSRTGFVLADKLGGHTELLGPARAMMQGAARAARLLRCGVFDVLVARRVRGAHMLLVSMGAAMALVAVEESRDPHELRKQILGVAA